MMHYRFNFNIQHFNVVEDNSLQHYEPLLKHVHVPTLVIDIYLVEAKNLVQYVYEVLELAHKEDIKFDQIIFDATLDPLNEYIEVVRILNLFAKHKSLKCFLALSQFDLRSHTHLTEINYPAWLFVFKKQKFLSWSESDKSYEFSCLNRNPTWHRLLFYSMIKQAGLLDNFVYSFYDKCPYQGRSLSPSRYSLLRNISGETWYQRCLQNINDFPISWDNEILGNNDHSINHDAYTNTWCNVVTESSATAPFTSEKIWKPIAAGQLFLVIGAPGTTKWLNTIGINTFSDSYDNEKNVVTRFTKVIEVICEHVEDPRAWWMQNKDAIRHNYEHFHSGNIENMLLEPIINQLNHK